jgi:hypothetical protein
MKKKVEFEKGMAAPKTPRFGEYIQRAVEEESLEARKPDSHTATLPNSTPVTVLRPEAREAAASIGKAPAEAYAVAPRRLKDEVKAGLNTEKLLTIIMSTQVEGVTVGDLMANCPHVYRTFFGRATPENRKEKKDSAAVNRTSVSARAASLRENPVAFRTSPRVTVTLDDSVELRGLIDSGAEINCIDKATYEQLTGVVMTPSPNMEMVSHSNHRVPFMGVCENVRLAVGPIEYEVCLFVIDVKTSHSLVLGAPFIFQSDLSLGTEEDTGRQFGTVKDIDRRLTARFYTGPSNNAGRRRVEAGAFGSLNL